MKNETDSNPEITLESGTAKIPVNLFVIPSSLLPEMISKGIDRWAKPLYIIITIVFGLQIFFTLTPFWKDSTDPEHGRSGLVIKTDNLTGCQYLSGRQGLTPRLDTDGNQICSETE